MTVSYSPNTEAACAAFRAAAGMASDFRAGAMALLAAARACELGLRDEMPAAAVDELLSLLDSAGGLLLEHGGPLDLVTAAGSA